MSKARPTRFFFAISLGDSGSTESVVSLNGSTTWSLSVESAGQLIFARRGAVMVKFRIGRQVVLLCLTLFYIVLSGASCLFCLQNKVKIPQVLSGKLAAGPKSVSCPERFRTGKSDKTCQMCVCKNRDDEEKKKKTTRRSCVSEFTFHFRRSTISMMN